MTTTDPATASNRIFVLILVLSLGVSTFALQSAEAQDGLVPVYSVSGTVYSERGDVLADVEVQARHSDGTVYKATTGSAGTYRLENLPGGTYNLTATLAGYTTGFQQVTLGGSSLDRNGLDFYLRWQELPRSGSAVHLEGTTIHLESKEPVANVRINFENWYNAEAKSEEEPSSGGSGGSSGSSSPDYYYDSGYQWFEVLSDAEGRWSLDVNKGSLSIWADADGFDYTRGSLQADANRTLEIPLRPNTAGTAVIEGIVTGDDGKPIPNAYVNVGRDYRSSCGNGVCYAEPARAVAPSEPYPGEGEFWFESKDGGWANTQTAKDGSYRMSTTPGQVRLSVWAEGYLSVDKGMLLEQNKTHNGDLVMKRIPPDSIPVSGVIRDAVNGDPIPYAQVSLQNQKWGAYNWTQADKQGQYTFMAKPGHTVLEVYASERYWVACEYEYAQGRPEGGEMVAAPPSGKGDCGDRTRDHAYYGRVLTLSLNEGEPVSRNFDMLRFPAPDAAFRGWVINATTQEGIPNAYVSFYNERTRDWGQATTDEDGSYRIKVHSGYYTVRAWADGYFQEALNTEVAPDRTKTLAISMTAGRSMGGCCYGYYGGHGPEVAVADSSAGSDGQASSAPGAAPRSDESATAGGGGGGQTAAGQEAYKGEHGGLGKYDPNSIDQDDVLGTPSVGPLAVLAVVAALAVATRRRRA